MKSHIDEVSSETLVSGSSIRTKKQFLYKIVSRRYSDKPDTVALAEIFQKYPELQFPKD